MQIFSKICVFWRSSPPIFKKSQKNGFMRGLLGKSEIFPILPWCPHQFFWDFFENKNSSGTNWRFAKIAKKSNIPRIMNFSFTIRKTPPPSIFWGPKFVKKSGTPCKIAEIVGFQCPKMHFLVHFCKKNLKIRCKKVSIFAASILTIFAKLQFWKNGSKTFLDRGHFLISWVPPYPPLFFDVLKEPKI